MGDGAGHGDVGCLRAADHLHERHPPDGIEEVEPTEAGGVAERFGELGDRVGRGVGGDDGVGADNRLDLGEDLPLQIGALQDALDDEIGIGKDGGVGGAAEEPGQPEAPRLVRCAQRPVPGRFLKDLGHAPGQRLGLDIAERHAEPGPEVAGGDPRTHDSGADHRRPFEAIRECGRAGGCGNRRGARIDLSRHAAVAPVPLAEPEDPQQVLRDGGAGEPGECPPLHDPRLIGGKRGGCQHCLENRGGGGVVPGGPSLDDGSGRGL